MQLCIVTVSNKLVIHYVKSSINTVKAVAQVSFNSINPITQY